LWISLTEQYLALQFELLALKHIGYDGMFHVMVKPSKFMVIDLIRSDNTICNTHIDHHHFIG
jgi:hypothetical protein